MNSASASSLRWPRPSRSLRRAFAGGQVLLVFFDVAGKAARDRPDAAGVELFSEHRVGHQAHDAAVAVKRTGESRQAGDAPSRRQGSCPSCRASVDLFEALHKARHGARADRDVAAHLYIARAVCAGDDPDDSRRCFRASSQSSSSGAARRSAGEFLGCRRCEGAAVKPAVVDPLLDGDMRPGFKLQIALFGIVAVVVLEGALDIDRVGVVPLDQVAVVAVHRPHEIGERGHHAVWEALPEARPRAAPVRPQGRSVAVRPGAFAHEQRFHQADGFTSISAAFNVRFHVLFFLVMICE